MPSARTAPSERGSAARARSRRPSAVGSGVRWACAAGTTTAASASAAAAPSIRANRMERFLGIGSAVRVEHVLEPHPLRIEVEIDVAGGAVPVLDRRQLGRAFDAVGITVHLLAEKREHHVGVLL